MSTDLCPATAAAADRSHGTAACRHSARRTKTAPGWRRFASTSPPAPQAHQPNHPICLYLPAWLAGRPTRRRSHAVRHVTTHTHTAIHVYTHCWLHNLYTGPNQFLTMPPRCAYIYVHQYYPSQHLSYKFPNDYAPVANVRRYICIPPLPPCMCA